jgi:sulfite exporter TauE/SafE
MVRRLHRICTYLLIALGVVHTSLTPVFNKEFSVDAMYFASAGLAMVVIGFLNIAMSRNAGDRLTVILCRIANVLFTVFGLLTALAIREPQAYFGIVLLLTITMTSFWARARKVSR